MLDLEELEERELDAFRKRYIALAKVARQAPPDDEAAAGTPEVNDLG